MKQQLIAYSGVIFPNLDREIQRLRRDLFFLQPLLKLFSGHRRHARFAVSDVEYEPETVGNAKLLKNIG